jgi:hypothetical protein
MTPTRTQIYEDGITKIKALRADASTARALMHKFEDIAETVRQKYSGSANEMGDIAVREVENFCARKIATCDGVIKARTEAYKAIMVNLHITERDL